MSTRFDTATDDRRPPQEAEPDEKKKVLDLSLTQIVGGALAAMTAAALGSTLGVGGTVAGAAMASVVAGVAGSLYTASLRSGRERVRTVLRPGGTTADSAPPAPIEAATTVIPRTDRGAAYAGPSPGAGSSDTETPVWDPVSSDGPSLRSRRSFPWKRAVAVSLAVFALAAVLITGYERVSGASLSGGSGTTVTQVGRDAGASGGTDRTPSPASSASSTPSASDSPSASTSPQVGGEPSASESASTPAPSASESSAAPSESGSPTPSTGPTGAATAG